MEIYLDHPKHGATVAHDNETLERLKKLGWTLRNPQPGLKPSANPLATMDREAPRRGRKQKGTEE